MCWPISAAAAVRPEMAPGRAEGQSQQGVRDVAAVAKDLIARKVTSTEHLGTLGGSNGGLLMGNMLTQYPELFGAIVSQVPLLDMQRYHKLLAGASWIAGESAATRTTRRNGGSSRPSRPTTTSRRM